ncbi:MAG: class I SAM-dependent methyltransferase [Blautia sp.]|nr:class I SAM-dependent methyltransferase [Blautia sp.]
MKEVYVGCGMSAVEGMMNMDNSISVILAHHKILYKICNFLKLINKEQQNFISNIKDKKINYGSATKLPFDNESVDVVYSSHMIEHLYKEDFQKFLDESYRVLKTNGVFRLVVPDLQLEIKKYNEDGDADAFCAGLYMASYERPNFFTKLRLLLYGNRYHKWMYDGKSMKNYIETHSKFKATILPAGKTLIKGNTKINLYERDGQSLYMECIKTSKYTSTPPHLTSCHMCNYTYYVLNLYRPLDTSVVYDVVCQTYIYYTAEFPICVLCSPLPASISLPSSAGDLYCFIKMAAHYSTTIIPNTLIS